MYYSAIQYFAGGGISMERHTLLRQLAYLVLISGGVYLAFVYLLPLFFPFLLAYIIMRILWPVMDFLHRKWRWHKVFSHYGVLVVFLGSILTGLFMLLCKLSGQLRLFFNNFPMYQQLFASTWNERTAELCKCADYYLHLDSGTADRFLAAQLGSLEKMYRSSFTTHVGKTLLSCINSSVHFIVLCVILVIAMFLLVKEMEPLNQKYRENKYYGQIHSILLCMKQSGISYLRAEGLILIINWIVCALGLFLAGNPYFFLFGMGIAIFDAFPILGSGLVLVPMSIYEFVNGHYLPAAILLTTYLITFLAREFLEAKLLGKGMGLNPFIMLAAIFIGIELFGVAGILLGPLAVVLIRTLMAECVP